MDVPTSAQKTHEHLLCCQPADHHGYNFHINITESGFNKRRLDPLYIGYCTHSG